MHAARPRARVSPVFAAALAALAGLVLGACDQRAAQVVQGPPTASPTARTQTVSAASIAFGYSPREMAARSDVVVVATVVGQRVVRDGGTVPSDVPGVSVATETTVAVERVVRDPRQLATGAGARLVVRTLGADGGTWVEDEPTFTVGERVVLFLTALGDGRYRCTNLSEGAVPVQGGMVAVPPDAPKTEAAFIAELQGV